jgi:hypothetical protein
MGEYVRIHGQEVKIGTCERMYYIRFDEFRRYYEKGAIGELPGNANPHMYMGSAHEFWWRFPYPHEDGQTVGDFHDRDHEPHTPLIAMPESVAKTVPHGNVVTSLRAPGGHGYQCNVWIPCPYGPMPEGMRTSPVPPMAATIVGERVALHDRDDRSTTYSCIYCREWFRLEADDLAQVRADSRNREIPEILERLRAWKP